MRVLATATILILMMAIASGCAPEVSSLSIEEPLPAWPRDPFPASVTVEPMEVRDTGFPRQNLQGQPTEFEGSDLMDILREHRIFAKEVSGRSRDTSTDLVLRGKLTSRWNPRGAANFFTWWPGGLALAPNWYGTRMEYFAEATVELFDQRTGTRISTYRASSAYEVIHSSATPGPFFGAVIIVPNVVKGARLTYPRERYRDLVYPIAHTRLWEKVAAQIVEERTPVYAAAANDQRRRCGEKLNRHPRVGQLWLEFVDCQTGYYELEAQVGLAEGSASEFVDVGSGLKISVVNGKIVRWENPTATPHVSAPPR